MRDIITLILLFIQLISYISGSKSNLIEIPFYHRFSNNKIKVHSGEPKVLTILVLDLTSKSTWMHKDTSILSSTSIDNHNNAMIHYNNKSVLARETEDLFYIAEDTNASVPNFPIYIINNRSQLPLREAEGVLGLGYSFPNNKYSIIHQLKKHNLIDHLSFSIINPGSIIFGGIKEKAIRDRYHSYCNVIGKDGNWNCLISNVTIAEKNKSVTYFPPKGSIVTFITNNHINYAPKAFMELLTQEFFIEKLNNKHYRQVTENNRKHIYASDEDHVFNGDLILEIGDYSYNIDFEYFWDCFEEGCELDLFENPNGDDWILGSSFIRIFNSHFDYEEKRINFYSHSFIKIKRVINDNKLSLKLRISVLDSVLLFIGSIIVIVISIYLKNSIIINII